MGIFLEHRLAPNDLKVIWQTERAKLANGPL